MIELNEYIKKVKLSSEVQNTCNNFEIYEVCDALEKLMPQEDQGYGLWQTYVYIIANTPKTQNIINSIEYVVKGKYWTIVNNLNITMDICSKLEDLNLYLLEDLYYLHKCNRE